MEGYNDVIILIHKDGLLIKEFPTIIMKRDPDPINTAVQKLSELYKWELNVDYDHFIITDKHTGQKLHTKTKTTEMTKKTTPIKDVQRTEELSVFADRAKSINLPAIPDVMLIGGLEYSEKLLRTEVSEVKKITLKNNEDKETYNVLLEKRKQLVKTRTAAEAFRKDVVKPLADWQKDLKAKTDLFGSIAIEGQDHCDAQIKIYEDWEAEQERLKQEALDKIINARIADLQSVQGILNPASGHWTFIHMPSKLVEHSFISTADDSEWNGLMKDLELSMQAEQDRITAEKAESEKNKNLVYTTRVQMLQLLGYDQNGDNFYKNGHSVTPEIIRDTADVDWPLLINSHNTAKQNTNPFDTSVTKTTADVQNTESFVKEEPTEQQSNTPFNPFAAFISPQTGQTNTVAVETEKTQSEEKSATTLWLAPFVERVLNKTTLRIFPDEGLTEATEGITNESVTYSGRWENGINFILFKNS